ncbi:hypothetical protein MMPV_005821 [Pyropia vietnamensis]
MALIPPRLCTLGEMWLTMFSIAGLATAVVSGACGLVAGLLFLSPPRTPAVRAAPSTGSGRPTAGAAVPARTSGATALPGGPPCTPLRPASWRSTHPLLFAAVAVGGGAIVAAAAGAVTAAVVDAVPAFLLAVAHANMTEGVATMSRSAAIAWGVILAGFVLALSTGMFRHVSY